MQGEERRGTCVESGFYTKKGPFPYGVAGKRLEWDVSWPAEPAGELISGAKPPKTSRTDAFQLNRFCHLPADRLCPVLVYHQPESQTAEYPDRRRQLLLLWLVGLAVSLADPDQHPR